MAKRRMAELTGGEAREIYARNPVILLPMGSHEDQGPHAPMGDYLSADKIAELIAVRASERGTETYVAPVLPFGGADYFGAMPGGIALSQATLLAVIADMLGCLRRHGLSRIVVINGHGGNVQAIHDATATVWRQDNVFIPSLYLWRIAYGLLPGIVGADVARRASGHGADPLSSVVMHLFPHLIRADLVPEPTPRPMASGLQTVTFGVASFEGVEVGIPHEYNAITENGVVADARLSSADTGAKLVEQLTEIGARFVAHYAGVG